MLVLNIFLISRYLLNSSLQSLYLLSKVTSVNNNYLKIKLKMKMHKICMKTYRFIMSCSRKIVINFSMIAQGSSLKSKKNALNPLNGASLVVNCSLCSVTFFLDIFPNFYLYFSMSHYLFLLIKESTFRIISLFLDIT